jgi:hypothetical protein
MKPEKLKEKNLLKPLGCQLLSPDTQYEEII